MTSHVSEPHAPSAPSSASMTRHERVARTLRGEQTGRAPAYVCGIASSVASAILGRTAHTGGGELRYAEVAAWAAGEQAHADFEGRMLDDLQAIGRALDLDVFRMPWRMNSRPAKRIDEYTFLFGEEDGVHSIWRYKPQSDDFGAVKTVRPPRVGTSWLVEEVARAEAQLAEPFDADAPAHEFAAEQARFGREFFVVANGGGISVGYDPDYLMALSEEPDLMRRLMLAQAEAGIRKGEALARLAEKPSPVVLLGGGDLADTKKPFYSPEAFRAVVLPAYVRLVHRLNALGIHYVFRSDGNLWKLAQMLFEEAGCGGFGEVDRDASMNAGALRARFPKLAIWGNLSSAFLAGASAGEVKDEARRILDECGGAGCFQGCSNLIVHGTPPANVEALFSVR
ncbi:MAG: uroporphyrinogen decarboxylase family protein [Planctomycetes bacterium]|nr:uroporphyrinogen decarboxylase family protein [Planctomycetota bacterium]